MTSRKRKVIKVDATFNVVHTSDGHIYPVEMYLDEFDEPCVYDDCVKLTYEVNGILIEYTLDGLELDRRDDFNEE